MTTPDPSDAMVRRDDSARTIALIVYLLYLAALVNGVTALIGVILAYIKRDEAQGSIYESHFSNQIEMFWLFVACCIGVALLWWTLIIFPVVAVLYVWILFRTVKGLMRASDGRPYF